jgi:hypothetical protein
VVDLGFFNGRADDEMIVFKGGLGLQCFHGDPNLPNHDDMFSAFFSATVLSILGDF